MKINKTYIRGMIRESIQDQIGKLREKDQAHTSSKAKTIVDVLKKQAKACDDLAKNCERMCSESSFGALNQHKQMFEQMRDEKLAKAESIAARYGIQEEKEVVKKKPAPKKKPAAPAKKKETPKKKEEAKKKPAAPKKKAPVTAREIKKK